jgi:OOP family OmpA-OmpF porin
MKNPHALRLIALASLGALLASPALAQDSYNYFGLSVGKSRARLDNQGIANSVIAPGQTASLTSSSPKDTGYKVFGGYQLNRNLAFELGFFKLGEFELGANTTPAGTLKGQVRVQGANFDLVGLVPLSENFSLLGRLGLQYARIRDNFSGAGTTVVTNPTPSHRNTNYKVGVGAQYAFSPSVQMRLEAERYRVDDALGRDVNANMYSVGFVFPFGRSAAPVRRVMAEPVYVPIAAAPPPPAPVVMAPMPAPVVAVAPMPVAKAMPTRVSFAAESLYGFDRAELRPEGKVALDTFLREMQGSSFEFVVVEGHTDRLGSTAYNQKLSQERADAVKAYLVNSGGLNPAKVTAVGKSESMPVTKAEDCKGHAQTAKLVACLQADRRVEIEVSGTR